jgi:TRAP transporter 4TM/12TM fusion protein
MGAVAFLMSNYLGMPYGKIILYAFLPAVLYYLGVYFAVHFGAKKRRLPVIPKDELPHLFPILKRGWYFSIPILLLIVLLIKQYSIVLAVLVPLYTLMAIMIIHPQKGLKSKLFDIGVALRDGAKNALLVAIALAVGNLIEGLISITGVALKLSIVLVHFSPNIYVLLGLSACTLFLLGLALPSFVIYITAVPILVPAMGKFGIDPVAAHLFLVYWAVLSMITPPTGASFYAAAGVAGAPVMKVGWTATRIAAPIYLLTFIFTLHPALLFRGATLWETIYYFLPAVLGVIAISSANAGYLLSDLSFFHKVMLVVGGIFLIFGHYVTFLLGIFALGMVFYPQMKQKKLAMVKGGYSSQHQT